MAIVQCNKVEKKYDGGAGAVLALREIDLTIEPGEFTAIAGPSGSGKTTLLNLIGALDTPTSGTLIVAGQELSGLKESQLSKLRLHSIGFIFQYYNLVPVLSALENVEFVMLLQGVPRETRHAKSRELLERVGLAELIQRRPSDMSGGQQQRVAVARAIAANPELVLADEPTANLDQATGASLLDLMAELNRNEGTTFIFSSHDPMVMERSHRLVTLRDGAIIEDERRE
ncbi:MAG: ABC transporter ATP-binding protein [Candidatus Alcyoniella australis]|nr:ABC transporter ATP-binding protein [Candidatus Alcyoniella australis]